MIKTNNVNKGSLDSLKIFFVEISLGTWHLGILKPCSTMLPVPRLTLPFLILGLLLTQPLFAQHNAALPENTTLPFMRTYLSALIAESDALGAVSPLDAEMIRAEASMLIRDSRDVKTTEDEEKLLDDILDIYAKIFPEDDDQSLDNFTVEADRNLHEILDALPLLIAETIVPIPLLPTHTKELENALDALITGLPDIESALDLTIWLSALHDVSSDLIADVPMPPLPVLKNDVRVLMTQLRGYMQQLESENTQRQATDDILTLLSETLERAETNTDMLSFFEQLEEAFESIKQATLPLPDTP